MKYEIRYTEIFSKWARKLPDEAAKARVQARIVRLETGNFGDVSPVGNGISELRIHYGPGYRVYFGTHGKYVVLLLCGGDKSTQNQDILRAKQLFAEIKKNEHKII
ncbi:MAG: type II toxin-antitoxin system RelE/ParE family toxin [Candidatus Symbiodolus clandestinus]